MMDERACSAADDDALKALALRENLVYRTTVRIVIDVTVTGKLSSTTKAYFQPSTNASMNPTRLMAKLLKMLPNFSPVASWMA